MTRNNLGFTFLLILHNAEMSDRVTIGNETWCVRPGNKTPEHAVENIEFASAEKHACLARKGTVHYEFTAQGQTVNQQCYLEVLTRLRDTVRRKSPKLWPDN
jgi:hypothetical protein